MCHDDALYKFTFYLLLLLLTNISSVIFTSKDNATTKLYSKVITDTIIVEHIDLVVDPQ